MSVNLTGPYGTNVAEVTASDTADPDSTPGNGNSAEDDYATAAATPVPAADLAIIKTDGSTTYIPGQAISYIITVTNNGPSTVTSLTVTDVVPAAITSPAFTPSAGAYAAGTGAWTGLSLASGQSVSLTLTGLVGVSASGALVNTATVAPPSGTVDPTAGNNTSTDIDADSTEEPSATPAVPVCSAGWSVQTFTFTSGMQPAGPPACIGLTGYQPAPCYYQAGSSNLRFSSRGAIDSGAPVVSGTFANGIVGAETLRIGQGSAFAVPPPVSNPPSDPGLDVANVGYFEMEFLDASLQPKPMSLVTFDIHDIDLQNSGSDYTDTVRVTAGGYDQAAYPATIGGPCYSTFGTGCTGTGQSRVAIEAGGAAGLPRAFGTMPVTNDPGSPEGTLRVQFTMNVPKAELQYYTSTGTGTARDIDLYQIHFCEASPTLALISAVRALPGRGEGILEFTTSSEVGPFGFLVRRLDEASDRFVEVGRQMIPAFVDSAPGGVYRVADPELRPGRASTYQVVEVRMDGNQDVYGPFTVTIDPLAAMSQREAAEVEETGYSRTAHVMNAIPAARPAGTPAIRTLDLPRADLGRGVKLGIVSDGLYVVSSASLAALTGSAEAETRNLVKNRLLQLRNRGEEVPFHPMPEGAGIVFYGRKPSGITSRANVYWIQKSRLWRGRVMEERDGRVESSAEAQTYSVTRTLEVDKVALTSLDTVPGTDFWYWEVVTGNGNKTFTGDLDSVATTGEAGLLRLHVRNAVGNASVARITVNGTVIGQGPVAGGINRSVVEVPLPQEVLKEGKNDIRVDRIASGAPNDGFFVDRLELTYERTDKALAERVEAVGTRDEAVVTFTGFGAPGIHVVDVMVPTEPVWMSGTLVEPDGNGYRVSTGARGVDARFVAASDVGLRTPAWVEPASVMDLKTATGGRYLIVTPSAFTPVANALADYRKNLDPMVIDLQSIYDGFSHGIPEPDAIRSFVRYAVGSWRVKPETVVLLGNGTFDYKDFWGRGDNFLPPLYVSVAGGGLFASDNSLADLDGDGRIDLAIGRIPILTVEQGMNYLSKVRQYEQASGAWQGKVSFWADVPDATDYGAQSNKVSDALGAGYQKSFVTLGQTALPQARQAALGGLASGLGLVNYTGHGGTDRLAKAGLLTETDVPGLTNDGKYPVFTALSCVINRFDYPGYASIGELLTLRASGGAIAVIAPSSISFPGATQTLNEELLRAMQGGGRTLGEAMKSAFAAYGANGLGNVHHLRTYTLLGDPAIVLRIP
jgi:uncharacterized repeat protein (TIGR01451 family)